MKIHFQLINSNLNLKENELASLQEFFSKVAVRHVMQIEDPLMEFDVSTNTDGPLFVTIHYSYYCLVFFKSKYKMKLHVLTFVLLIVRIRQPCTPACEESC